MLSGVNKKLGVHWLPHQPSHVFDDVSTKVFDRALVIVIPSHILQSGVFFFQYVVIVSLHALLLDPTLDICVLFTRRKRVVRIVL